MYVAALCISLLLSGIFRFPAGHVENGFLNFDNWPVKVKVEFGRLESIFGSWWAEESGDQAVRREPTTTRTPWVELMEPAYVRTAWMPS